MKNFIDGAGGHVIGLENYLDAAVVGSGYDALVGAMGIGAQPWDELLSLKSLLPVQTEGVVDLTKPFEEMTLLRGEEALLAERLIGGVAMVGLPPEAAPQELIPLIEGAGLAMYQQLQGGANGLMFAGQLPELGA